MKNLLLASFLSFLFAANAYLPPVEERAGVKVEIGSFPQKTERTNKNPYAWPLGVTEVKAGAPRAFPVMLENRTEKSVTGRLEVWMNDHWTVAGGQGEITLDNYRTRILSTYVICLPNAVTIEMVPVE